MVIRGYRIGPLLKKTGREILDDNVLGLAAQTAYYFFFSLFPLLLFLAPLLGLIGDKEALVGWLVDQARTTVPDDALSLLEGVITDVVYAEGAPGLMSIGILLALWTGSNVFNALIGALNRAFDCEDGRPWWKRRLIAIATVFGAGLVILITTVVMLAGPDIVDWAAAQIGLGAQAAMAWKIVQYALAVALLIGTMWLVYWFLPASKGHSKRHVLVGAVTATALWLLVTVGFRQYVSNFADFNATYGTIGGVIMLLMWMYLTMLVVLIGGELIAELEKGTGALRPRSGATYTGRLSTSEGPVRTSTERIERVEPLAARSGE